MWENRYAAAGDYLFGKAPAQFLLDNPGWVRPGLKTLCVADGEGRNGVYLAGQGAEVHSFDLSETAVARTQELAAEQGVSVGTRACLWGEWDWDGSAYDLVVAVFIQFVGPEERLVHFADLKRAVRPGGILMLHGYRPEQIELGTGGPPSAANMYTEDMLRDTFGDWQIKRLASYECDVQEGRGHSGKSALIDLIVQRPV